MKRFTHKFVYSIYSIYYPLEEQIVMDQEYGYKYTIEW